MPGATTPPSHFLLALWRAASTRLPPAETWREKFRAGPGDTHPIPLSDRFRTMQAELRERFSVEDWDGFKELLRDYERNAMEIVFKELETEEGWIWFERLLDSGPWRNDAVAPSTEQPSSDRRDATPESGSHPPLPRVSTTDTLTPSFEKQDWRTLEPEERSRRIDHVCALLKSAEDSGAQPPSWRGLEGDTGVSAKTLRAIPKLWEAYRDAEREAAERKVEAARRHSQPGPRRRRLS